MRLGDTTMKKTVLCILFECLLLCLILPFNSIVFAEDSVDNARKFRLFDGQYLKVDLKFADQNKGDFGIDYKLNLEKKMTPIKKNGGYLNLNMKSDGFVMVDGKENKLNSIINEINIELLPLYKIPGAKVGEPLSIPDELTEEQEVVLQRTRRQAEIVHSPLWLNVDLHLKHETTQDFKDYDLAFGTAMYISTSYLHAPLDYLFGLLRTRENNNPRQLEIAVGYDYVVNLDQTANAIIRENDKNAHRLNLKAEWETGIFKASRIIFVYNSYYEFDAPKKVKEADKDFNSFFMVKLEHLLYEIKDATVKFAIKYTDGELPPNFEKGAVIGGGFSFEF